MDISRHTRSLFAATAIVLAVLTTGVVFAACGDDDDDGTVASGGSISSQAVAGNGVDRAFVEEMTRHHKSAVEMAKIAERRGQSRFVKKLASDIVRTQTTEISTLRTIAKRLTARGVKAGELGVPKHQTGMRMDAAELRSARPFDRAFIDMMVPHHQGAIRMARAELAKGENPQAKSLARAIIAAQSREIRAMNEHRTRAFGAPSPAGGIPMEETSEETGSGMPSGGH